MSGFEHKIQTQYIDIRTLEMRVEIATYGILT
jgi:hypothetical protein